MLFMNLRVCGFAESLAKTDNSRRKSFLKSESIRWRMRDWVIGTMAEEITGR